MGGVAAVTQLPIPLGGGWLQLWLGALALGIAVGLAGRWIGGWARIASRYPSIPRSEPAHGVWMGMGVLGSQKARNSVRLWLDATHLHVEPILPLRVFRPSFSIPLTDIRATPERWGLFPVPVVRLTLQRDPTFRFLVLRRAFDRLAAASGGRLHLNAG
jgi:hypothetical protein